MTDPEPSAIKHFAWKALRFVVGTAIVAAVVFVVGIMYFRMVNVGRTCCVAEGTLVHTPVGTQSIESLQVGDEVLSYDFKARKWVVNTVVETYRKVDLTWIEVELPGGMTLRATCDHLAYDMSTGTYRPVGNVAAFAVVASWRSTVRSTSPSDRRRRFGHQTFHDLHLVGEPRNYLANGVVVHNKL